jgi:hypothetical protein
VKCFVISPIGDPDSTARDHSNKVLRHIIIPVLEAAGFSEIVRADQIGEPGVITTQIIRHLVEDDLVVADLSGGNPNVFYELAVRHASRKPCVQLIAKTSRLPFDVSAARTISFDVTDLDSVEEAKDELKRQAEFAVTNPGKVQTPISSAIDLAFLEQSGDPAEKVIARFSEQLSVLHGELQSIGTLLKRQEAGFAGQMLKRLESIEGAVQNVAGFTDLDDIMSKLEDIERAVERG